MKLSDNATYNDFMSEVLETKRKYQQDLEKYNWKFEEYEETIEQAESVHIFTCINGFTITEIKLYGTQLYWNNYSVSLISKYAKIAENIEL